MVVSTHKIQIVTEYLQKGFTKMREQTRGFNAVMGQNIEQFKASRKLSRGLTESLGNQAKMGTRVASKVRRMTHGMRGFRMEMLGVMFFGMMLQRAFSSLIKTSLEWMGVTEIMTFALGILFLPIAETLLNWALIFLNAVNNLTEDQKKWIGIIVLTGAALGGLLFLIGTFALGIGSVILVFRGLTGPISLIIGLLLALGLGKVISDFDLLGSKADGAKSALMGFGITSEVFEKVFNAISSMVSKIGNWIVDNAQEIMDKGLDILTKIVEGISNNSDKIADALEAIVESMLTWITNNAGPLFDIGAAIAIGILKGLWSWLTSMIPQIIGAAVGGAVGFVLGGPAGAGIGGAAGIAAATEFFPTVSSPNVGGSSVHTPPNMTIAPQYNVVVSDKSEFERMLEENNRSLTEDTRRLFGG